MRFRYPLFSLIGLLILLMCAFSLPSNTPFDKNSTGDYHQREGLPSFSEDQDLKPNNYPINSADKPTKGGKTFEKPTPSREVTVATYVQYNPKTGKKSSFTVITTETNLHVTCLEQNPSTGEKVRHDCQPTSTIKYSITTK